MKTNRILLWTFIATIFLVAGCTRPDHVCFQEACYDVEVVDTPETRQQGLMYRTSLDENSGMLFVFEESGIYPFWMKNTLIPLDMIWIDENMKIVHIARDVSPCTEDPCPPVNPKVAAKYVVELNSGQAQQNGLHIGQKVLMNI